MDGGLEIVNCECLCIYEYFQGLFGFGSFDDVEVWECVQVGLYVGCNVFILVNCGLNCEWVDDNGDKVLYLIDEIGMCEVYVMWKKMMEK